ncbi:MAG: ABC transporter substrate-binding protein [Pseudomonadota bacterium]
MTTTRRTFLGGTAATAAMLSTPAIRSARAQADAANTVTAVMHGDLRSFDPIWTTANITSYHGAMIYDTLFSYDANFRPQPQMVGKFDLSDDQKTYTFELRDGLSFSDGSPVTAKDCVASIRRWAARDGAAQHMFVRVKDTPVVDDKTFKIELVEPYGLVLDALGKVSTNCCYIMRAAEAETDPFEQITTYIGSGPFTYNQDASTPGQRYIYDKRDAYVPRSEPASGTAGGKVVYIDRAVFENIADEQTAMAALQAGEIDFYETPPIDLLPVLEADPNINVEIINKGGNVGMARLNFLHPPFDNEFARQAMLHLIKQNDILAATFGNPAYFQECPSLFGCSGNMQTDVNTGWYSDGQDIEKAKELFAKAGYDGRPVTVLQATNISFMNNAALLIAQSLRQAGINVQLEPSDWGGVVTRRAVKSPPADGGWNIFVTWASGHAFDNPIGLSAHAANGDEAWFGWPANFDHEAMRDAWASAPTFDDRKEVAVKLQDNAWNFVPMAVLGQWTPPVAYRNNLTGLLAMPEVVPFWNLKKT